MKNTTTDATLASIMTVARVEGGPPGQPRNATYVVLDHMGRVLFSTSTRKSATRWMHAKL